MLLRCAPGWHLPFAASDLLTWWMELAFLLGIESCPGLLGLSVVGSTGGIGSFLLRQVILSSRWRLESLERERERSVRVMRPVRSREENAGFQCSSFHMDTLLWGCASF